MMGKRPGELTVREAAERVGATQETVRRWCREAVGGDPRSKIEYCRRERKGFGFVYYVSEEEMVSINGMDPLDDL